MKEYKGRKLLTPAEKEERRKAINRAHQIRRTERYNNDPEYRERFLAKKRVDWVKYKEKENARKREKYHTDEEYRKKSIGYKAKWARENKARFRANWNAWYDRVKHTKRGQQLASRIRNRPLYGLARSLSDFENGIIGVDELHRLYDNALARVDDFCRRKLEDKRTPGMGERQRSSGKTDSGHQSSVEQHDETKTGYGENAP